MGTAMGKALLGALLFLGLNPWGGPDIRALASGTIPETAGASLLLSGPQRTVFSMTNEPRNPLRPEGLSFPDHATRHRHLALRRWIEEESGALRHIPLQVVGNFLNERWCAPTVSEGACASGAVRHDEGRGVAFRELSTLHYPQRLPQVFGLELRLHDAPRDGDLGVRFYLADAGGQVLADMMVVEFLFLRGDRVHSRLRLGDTVSYRAVDAEIRLKAPGGWRAELKRLTESPQSFRDTARARLTALLTEVLAAIDHGHVPGYDEGPYEGDGIPPRKTERPLTPDERTRERRAVERAISERLALVDRSFDQMHRRLIRVVPVDILLGE